MGSFNIDLTNTLVGFEKFNQLCDVFNLTNLTKSKTNSTNNHKSIIDMFFTNKPSSFHKNSYHREWSEWLSETDFHIFQTTLFKANAKNYEV